MFRTQRRFRPFEPVFLFAAGAGVLALMATACGETESGNRADPLTQPSATTDGMSSAPPPAPLVTSMPVTNPTVQAPGTSMSPDPAGPTNTVVTPTPPPVTPTPTDQPPAPEPSPPAPTNDMTPGVPDAGPTPPMGEPDSGAGSSETAMEPMPSPGCSGGNADAAIPNSIVDKPNGYDGSTPSPAFFAFHGAGGNSMSLQGPFASTAKERGYIGVYLKSTDSGWNVRTDTPVLDDAYDALLQNYCVDVNRIFAIGHSSGAQMITQLLCDGDTRFRAVAPVASSKYCDGWDPASAVVIHGVDDIERGGQGEMRYGLNDGDGHIDFGVYHDSNQCTDATTEFDPGGNCGTDIHPGCVEYDDCAVRTVFCNHDDPQYGTSNHGIPCFASQVIFDFFDEHQ